MSDDWPEPDTRHEEEVVVAHRVRVVRAQRICCLEHGVSTQIHLDVQGRIAGIPLELTIELDPPSALALAERFQQAVAG